MSFVEVQDEIVSLLGTLPNVTTYRGFTDDEALIELIASSNSERPFITISFGGLVEAPNRDSGIIGARYDTHDANFVIRTVASSDAESLRLWQMVWDLVLGYVPNNCGEIRSALFGGVGAVNALGNPTRHAAVQSYRFKLNSDLA